MRIKNPVKRKIIQIAAFGFSNLHLLNFNGGKIYRGSWKQFCNPGLNCYSCPAASLACPVGALQAVSGSMNFKFSFYVVGLLLAFGVALGRATNYMGMGKPAFCQYICPAGTLEGGIPLLAAHEELRQTIGPLFFLKLALLLATIAGCVLIYRFFCRAACPLGAIYGLMNKISVCRLRVDGQKCVSCGKCRKICKMEVDPVKNPDSAECIRCGACAAACPADAIHIGFDIE